MKTRPFSGVNIAIILIMIVNLPDSKSQDINRESISIFGGGVVPVVSHIEYKLRLKR
jgi:hypothetical protein